MSLPYPARLSLARLPTPLQYLPRASERLGRGHRLWVKRDDLTGAATAGNKLRKLEFIAALARERGCDTLITCGVLQSNHCRATALVAAQLGMRAHLVLRGEAPRRADGNLLLGHLAGARVSCYRRRQYASELPQLLEQWRAHYAERGALAHVIPTGGSDGTGLWGYLAAAEELAADMRAAGIEAAHWVCATGSGGTLAGLSLGAELLAAPATVWGVAVSDDERYFLDKIAEDIRDWYARYRALPGPPQPAIRVIDGYVAPGYGRASPQVFECIARLARLEGLVLDPTYTGKAFHGMLEQMEAGRFAGIEDIVFVHTGGIFGLFPQRDRFAFVREGGHG